MTQQGFTSSLAYMLRGEDDTRQKDGGWGVTVFSPSC